MNTITPYKRQSNASSRSSKRTRGTKTPVRKFVRSPRVTVPRFSHGFPKQLALTMKYTDSTPIALAGGAGAQLFSTNGLFKPDGTGAGHQPLYFDQLSLIYNNFHVKSSRIKWTFKTLSALVFEIVTWIEDDVTISATGINTAERPSAAPLLVFQPTGTEAPSVKQSWTHYGAFGNAIMANSNTTGTTVANPAQQQYFACLVLDGTGTTVTVTADVEIQYDCIWDELKSTAPS